MFSHLLTTPFISRLLASTGDPSINLSDYLVLKNGTKVSDIYKSPADMIILVVSNVFVVAGFMLFIFIIIAGFKFIAGDSKGMEEARNMMGGVLMGFIVMFAAYWIIQIIEQITGVKIIF